MPPVRAVLFDLWNTLIFDDAPSSQARSLLRIEMAREALASIGHVYDAAHVERAFVEAGAALEAIHGREVDISARARTVLYVRHIDESLPGRIPDNAWPALDTAVLEQAWIAPPAIIEGALEMLAEVKALGLPTALVSNAGATPGYVLRRVLDDFGLLQHLDETVFSDEVELSKPAPAIFRHALDALGVPAGEAVFLGDHPLLDVFGSLCAGLACVQVGNATPLKGAAPHARIDALAEFVPALRSLGWVAAPVA